MLKLLERWCANRMEGWRRRHLPGLVDWLLDLSLQRARKVIGENPPIILIDNSVLGHAVTHKTVLVTEPTQGYLARVPKFPRKDQSELGRSITYLPGIARMAQTGLLTIRTSGELWAERFHQPMGRYKGAGFCDFTLFDGIKMDSVDGYRMPSMGPSYADLPSSREQQIERINRSDDALYVAIFKLLGERSSFDAWHIRTAEKAGLFCFLTMDFKLRKAFERNKDKEPFKSLRTRVMTPDEFGIHFGLRPFEPYFMSYHRAETFVRSDLNWTDIRAGEKAAKNRRLND